MTINLFALAYRWACDRRLKTVHKVYDKRMTNVCQAYDKRLPAFAPAKVNWSRTLSELGVKGLLVVSFVFLFHSELNAEINQYQAKAINEVKFQFAAYRYIGPSVWKLPKNEVIWVKEITSDHCLFRSDQSYKSRFSGDVRLVDLFSVKETGERLRLQDSNEAKTQRVAIRKGNQLSSVLVKKGNTLSKEGEIIHRLGSDKVKKYRGFHPNRSFNASDHRTVKSTDVTLRICTDGEDVSLLSASISGIYQSELVDFTMDGPALRGGIYSYRAVSSGFGPDDHSSTAMPENDGNNLAHLPTALIAEVKNVRLKSALRGPRNTQNRTFYAHLEFILSTRELKHVDQETPDLGDPK